MTQQSTNTNIRAALGKMVAGDLSDSSTQLLAALGYRSDRLLDGQTGNVDHFMADFKADNTDTRSEQDFRDSAKEVRILFQFTETEIGAMGQGLLLGAEVFSFGNASSFLLAAVDLHGETYPRGRYVSFTREINKRFNRMPAAIVFRTADGRVTLAFVNRRPSKIRDDRQVLGSVSLIREINPTNPHRAHVDILAELSLPERLKWMDDHGKRHNFDGLLEAWLDALDTEELNRRFYRELKDWFDRAVKEARFPITGARVLKPEEHVIRLITRMLFVWFVKEKDLVAEDLFVENRIASFLDGYDRAEGDSYYRAVLQNLFFATLNTEIGRRSFSSQTNITYRDFSRYRYASEIADPDALLSLFSKTPFINGGLFDCLDSEEAPRDGGYRIDYFSDNVVRTGTEEYGKLSIPNRLFFDNAGLITLFDHYKFTVEENTPAEQEVALDPELLGKVFENLLAAYNPETRESARKQTGSYYTPRTVVDYMVDEALVGSIIQKVSPDDGDSQWWEERLHYLLDYNDAGDLFLPEEATRVIQAIAELKVLDPAVGSGAFPMSVLHKLTLALRRMDPDNVLWRALQEKIHGGQASDAFRKQDEEEQRARILEDINANFERYKGSDYGRKLYLIQNSIYGLDIQPVATQIAKLRFFISLAIEQQPDTSADNYGIQPLPNLETRFVAANSLLGLDKKALQIPLGGQNRVTELNDQLRENRERHFHAGVRREKLRLRAEDRRLRADLAEELQKAGMSKSDSGKIASWDPYDQNAHAEWFDAGYMFDISGGFDVVIGNPPYVQLQKDQGRLARQYQSAGYQTFIRTGDIYYLFYERGIGLLRRGSGRLCFISSNQWMRVDSGKVLREFLENQNPVRLVNLGAGVFDNVTVNTNVLLVNRAGNAHMLQAADVRQATDPFPPAEWTHIQLTNGETWTILPNMEHGIKAKMESIGTPLKDWEVKINYGIKTGYDKAFIVDAKKSQTLIKATPESDDIINPILRGRDIERYQANCVRFLIDIHNGYGEVPAVNVDEYSAIKSHLDGFKPQLQKRYDQGRTPYNLRNCAYYSDFAKGKIIWGNLNNKAKFAYAPGGTFISAPSTMLTPYSPYLLALLNSKLVDWYFRLIGVERDGGYYEYKPMFIERLPIPKISVVRQRPIVRLVERILAAKASNPSADTSELEEEIDWLVYDLYGLTNEETAVIEDFFWNGPLTEEEEDQALLRAMEEADIDDPDNFVSEAEVMATLRGLRDSHGN